MHSEYVAQTGPLMVGSLLGFFFNGVFATQLYDYYSGFHNPERRNFAYLVALVGLTEALHLVFSTHTLYAIMVEGFGDTSVLVKAPFSSAAMPALNGAVGLCTQTFFAWRILQLSKTAIAKVVSCIIVLTACLQCSAAIGLSVQFTRLAQDIALLQTLKATVTIWLSGSVACDMIILITMAVILIHQRLSVNYNPSKLLVNCLIIHTVENGLITTVVALAGLLTYLKLPESWYYICFEVLLGRMYAVVLLASLNGRQRMRFYFDTRENLEFRCTFDVEASQVTSDESRTSRADLPSPEKD